MPFDSAESAINSIIDPLSGEPSVLLIRLIEIHGGHYNPDDGLPGLRALTQQLWVPKDADGRPIKVPHMDVATLEAVYSDSVRAESWRLLSALGCLRGYRPQHRHYSFVIAHGTVPKYARTNLRALCKWIGGGVQIDGGIFMLSAPFMLQDTDSVSTLVRPKKRRESIPVTEAGSMAWLWSHTYKPAPARELAVQVISSSDALTAAADAPAVIPDTLDSLRAWHQCCLDPTSAIDPNDDYVVQNLPDNPTILNLAATRRQLLRQHVVTRTFFRELGINCHIDTMNAGRDKRPRLVLSLREVATLIWALCDELAASGS